MASDPFDSKKASDDDLHLAQGKLRDLMVEYQSGRFDAFDELFASLAPVAAAMRESVPGRAWSRTAIAGWFGLPLALLMMVTLVSWEMGPVLLLRWQWWLIGAACFGGSLATALPAVALASVLAARAYPTRPAVAGALLGLGAGLMADAGWCLFCHFSEPAHLLSAHVDAVIVSMLVGALLAPAICRVQRRS